MSSEFTVRGAETDFGDPHGVVALYGDELGITPRSAVSVSGPSRADAREVELSGADDDVVELEDTDGIVTFERAGPLVERARSRGALRGSGELDLATIFDETARGGGSRMAASVRRYSVALPPDIEAAVATLNGRGRDGHSGGWSVPVRLLHRRRTGSALRRRGAGPGGDAEDRRLGRRAGPGRRSGRPAPQAAEGARASTGSAPSCCSNPHSGCPPATADRDQPYLLLLHGTFSHTEGAFGSCATRRNGAAHPALPGPGPRPGASAPSGARRPRTPARRPAAARGSHAAPGQPLARRAGRRRAEPTAPRSIAFAARRYRRRRRASRPGGAAGAARPARGRGDHRRPVRPGGLPGAGHHARVAAAGSLGVGACSTCSTWSRCCGRPGRRPW